MSNHAPEMRASHADRDRVVEVLQAAAADGRLGAEELDTRVERALNARTRGELSALTADLPARPEAKEVLVIRQAGGKYVQDGRWPVPPRIDVHTQICRVTLDFTRALITSNLVRINAEMMHGRLRLVTPPGTVVDAGGLNLAFSKAKVASKDFSADAPLHIEVSGSLLHAKLIERRGRG
ncbi:DUF1707 domain-containing protein [Nocardiopsis sp. RSe5-2]|uniref:DUF1707 domain-containing protein n=1 Tax=Nocardiopsis endophytica TaxID=3018445 RepID=A0ABT4U4F3_9ACTN|nr:DUF1707 domain-containing protein [Nocardiopsis endophytica]MDA2811824.1 DUF1707 domain-containing protein [Nocardiopsis endophytica]